LHLIEDVVAGKVLDAEDDIAAQRPEMGGERRKSGSGKVFEIGNGRCRETGKAAGRHPVGLLAGDEAGAGLFRHGLNRGEAGHTAGCQGEKNQTQENAAQKPGIGLNCLTHPATPIKLRQPNQLVIHANGALVN
jgi:hypothetical protein